MGKGIDNFGKAHNIRVFARRTYFLVDFSTIDISMAMATCLCWTGQKTCYAFARDYGPVVLSLAVKLQTHWLSCWLDYKKHRWKILKNNTSESIDFGAATIVRSNMVAPAHFVQPMPFPFFTSATKTFISRNPKSDSTSSKMHPNSVSGKWFPDKISIWFRAKSETIESSCFWTRWSIHLILT